MRLTLDVYPHFDEEAARLLYSCMPMTIHRHQVETFHTTGVGELTVDAHAHGNLKNRADKPEASQLYPKKAMKAKKKEFLQRKKTRRKQEVNAAAEADSAGDDSGLEERVMTDHHKPAFGEQAMQPLKVEFCDRLNVLLNI